MAVAYSIAKRVFLEGLYFEGSYTTADIPKYYTVSFIPPEGSAKDYIKFVDTLMKGLQSKKIKGIQGVAAAPNPFVNPMLDQPIALLAMPGRAFEKANKLTRILYDNPDYLVSKGFKAFGRVMGYKKGEELFSAIRDIFDYKVVNILRKDKEAVKAIRQAKNLKEMARVLLPIVLKTGDSYTLDVILGRIKSRVLRMVTEYMNEDEWLVKNKEAVIPPKSTLIIVDTGDFDIFLAADWFMDHPKAAKTVLLNTDRYRAPEDILKGLSDEDAKDLESKVKYYWSWISGAKIAYAKQRLSKVSGIRIATATKADVLKKVNKVKKIDIRTI